MAETEKLDLGEEKPQSSKKTLIIVVVAVLLTVVAVLGTLYFLGIVPPKHGDEKAGHGGKSAEKSEEAHAEAEKAVLYLPLSPPFSANFKNNPEARVVQVDVTVASTDPIVIEAMKKHAPMLRNNLLLLLSGEDPSILKTAEGKEGLRVKIKEEIKKVIARETDRKGGVDEVYFTGFIMQ